MTPGSVSSTDLLYNHTACKLQKHRCSTGDTGVNKDWCFLPVECLKGSYTLLESLLGCRSEKSIFTWQSDDKQLLSIHSIYSNFWAALCIRQSNWNWNGGEKESKWTHCPLEEWINRVMSVEVPGHTQFKASMAYLNSSSHTTWSAGIGHKWPKPRMQTAITLRSIKLSTHYSKCKCAARKKSGLRQWVVE